MPTVDHVHDAKIIVLIPAIAKIFAVIGILLGPVMEIEGPLSLCFYWGMAGILILMFGSVPAVILDIFAKDVHTLDGCVLFVHFVEGVSKRYDIKPLMDKWPSFKRLADESFFSSVVVSPGGYGVIWDDELDLSCNELFHNGTEIKLL